jgi:hypothetical protein
MALTSMPYLTIQELDANGNPYVGAKLFFYAAGTTTKQNTYADANGSSANTNPVVLDSAGRATVFFQPLTYDVVLAPSTDTDPPVSPIWTRLGIASVPVSAGDLDISGTAGESLSAGAAVYLSDGSGGKTAGKWYNADADFTYASTLAAQVGMVQDAIASGASGSVRIGGKITGLSGLTAGTLYYISATAGALTSSAPANAKPIGVADSTVSVILQPPIPWASTTVPGLVSIGAQSFAGPKTFASAPVWQANPTGIGAFVTSYATGDTTKNNSTVLADVTGLSFAVLANASYFFQFILHGISAVAADYKFTLTGPAAPTAIRYGLTSISVDVADAAAFGTSIFRAASSVDEAIFIFGQLRNGANAGTVQLQFAQQTADVSNSKIYAESSVVAWRIS